MDEVRRMPKISVIMGVHNGEKTLPRAIDSVLNQTFADFELIICDDCSTDATIQVIKSYIEKDNRIILIKNKSNSGLAASLNNCINISNGEYIARMDDDDISHAERFEKQNNFLDKHREYAIVGTCRNTFDNAGIWNTYGQGGELTKEDIIKCNIFTHPTVMMRREALVSAGMYTVCERTMRGQDFDLWCKMYACGCKGYVLPDILFDYYEDRNKIKEIKAKYRLNNYRTHMIWRKKMGLSRKYDLYAYKELIAIVVPHKLLVKYGINRQKDKYTVDQKNRHIGISILYMLIFVIITYMGQARISRWYTLVSSIAAIFILISLFPEKTSIITITTVIPVVVLIVLASLLKAGLYTQGNHLHFQISELITPTSGDAYFAGPVSINNAIGLSKIKGIGFRNIIYDICNNMPIVNHFVKTGNSTAYLYNSYLGRIFNSSGGDQIISLVGQSGIFFSWIFAPLLSCISVLFLRFSDKKYLQTTNYMKYIWGFIAIWFGLETILNMTINLSWIYIRIIPMFIIFWLIDKISFKQIKKEVC